MLKDTVMMSDVLSPIEKHCQDEHIKRLKIENIVIALFNRLTKDILHHYLIRLSDFIFRDLISDIT